MTTAMKLESVNNQALESAPDSVERARNRRVVVPKSDIYETATNIVVLADMPGVDENSVDITVEKNVLAIRGFAEFEPPSGFSLSHAESAAGDYQRSFVLANEVDKDGISATMKNGVLKLILPKSSRSQVQKITVRSE